MVSRRINPIACFLILFVTSQSADAMLQMQLIGSHTEGDAFCCEDWGIVNFDVDPITGKSHPIDADPDRFNYFNDIDFGPDGKLYARSSGYLGTIDITTGAFTRIGKRTGILSDRIAFGPGGELFTNQLDSGGSKLYKVDLVTGELVRVGTGANSGFGIDFGPDGKLYASANGEIFIINVQTGQKDHVVYADSALPIFRGLDYGTDSVLRGLTEDELFRIDLENQTFQSLGKTTKKDMWGLASIHRSEPGDYIADGVVDGADYATWRNNYGAFEQNIAHAGNADGIVNAADYTVWRDRFYVPSGNATAVPEPTAQILTLIAMVLSVCLRR